MDILKDIDAVIFDLDGSLVDSMWMWHEIDVEYLGRYQLQVPEDLSQQIEGLSFSETAHYFKNRFRIPESVEEIKRTWNEMAWDKYMHEVPLKPGAAEFLKLCRKKGVKLGIATSNSRELVTNVADVLGLHDFFSCIMTGCDVGKGKPAPDIYLAVAKRLAVLPQRCLVFEDIIPGILAGRAAGMTVCAVEDAYSMDQICQKKELADYYIRDFYELWNLKRRPIEAAGERRPVTKEG